MSLRWLKHTAISTCGSDISNNGDAGGGDDDEDYNDARSLKLALMAYFVLIIGDWNLVHW